MNFVTGLIKENYESEKADCPLSYDQKCLEVHKVKAEYAKDLERYTFLFGHYRALMEKLDKAIREDDMMAVAPCAEKLAEVVEDIHRIHVRNNRQLCDIYNCMPG